MSERMNEWMNEWKWSESDYSTMEEIMRSFVW